MAKHTSKNGNFTVATLQPKTRATYEENVDYLLDYVENSDADLILAPELCLTNFDYENFEEAAAFYKQGLMELLVMVDSQILVLTMTVQENEHFYNRALVLHNHQVFHEQDKSKLFKLGNEDGFFEAGDKNKIVPFTINKVKYAILICFELRFKELWKQIEGADIVLIPARWGRSRTEHLETLSRALAIMNQTFVVLSNSADDDMALASAIISPWGGVYADDNVEVLERSIELKDVRRVRRLISMT
ncbi:MAG: Hydrolase [uncultured Sulfurovum sp.]|uniref:Hydrolase n=1 Tax=uncultured Sulfurovum sp. TaxID=269237 RepID=A0A6S6SIA2_9BACT|nr:MAG: Hydrolase [uncultured Sulfurovum sp.]